MKISDLMNVIEPAALVHMSMSSDKNWLALCVNGEPVDKRSNGVSMAVEGTTQWVCNLNTGEAFPIAPEANSSWAGVWSPEGKTLAFFADIGGKARLWLWDSTNHSLHLAADLVVRPFFGFEKPIWTKDGKQIIIKTMPDTPINENDFYSNWEESGSHTKLPQQVKVFDTGDISDREVIEDLNNWADRYRADIRMISVESQRVTTLCKGLRPVGMKLSTDGNYLAFTHCLGEENRNTQQNIFELWICPLNPSDTTEVKCVSSKIHMMYGVSFSWGNDNTSIYYTTSGPLSDGGLWVANTITNTNELLFQDKTNHLGHDFESPKVTSNDDVVMIAGGKLWYYRSTSGSLNHFSLSEGRIIVAGFPITKDNQIVVQTHEPLEVRDGFWNIDCVTGVANQILEEPKGHLPWFEGGVAYCDHMTETIAYLFQDADLPPTIRVFDVASKSSTDVTLSKLETDTFGSSEIIRWKGEHQELRGALLLPKDSKGLVPAIIRVYPGSMQSNNVRLFGMSPSMCDNHQIFASHGYAVFSPDLPMKRTHEPAEEITKMIADAYEALIKHPNIDSERIGIIGHSFGGYSTLVAITKLPHFKAAIVSSGIGNLISYYTQFDINSNLNYGSIEDGQFNIGATLWEERERYIKNSPLFEFHKIQTPVLITQGTRDHLCYAEAGPIFSSLNRLNKTAQLVLYDDEEHYQGTWRRENLEDYYERVLKWLDKYL
ncbi:S9 family peptidase [Fictibacillus sp. 5RED26]|jgi:dienelactone hydrolase|uniref:S9 family peptidase n=1 Tax=Fictibacillus sp. 5RED26 TaxID=2745876 RepID=UPI0018CD2C2D|nr:prolyl oligopeptidase family serine peptidase [Fictibacillus sp. 5RED26]MBH0159050.1 S9 family peptidase [Fictibacillus sp. 5RED26]